MSKKEKAIFLDRDGVINKEVNYLSNPKDFEFIPGSIKALRRLQEIGYKLIVITNQSGLARGYFTVETLNKIHNKMKRILRENNVILTDIFICPHHPDITGICECRKPKPGLLIQAKQKYNIDLKNSYMVGDTLKDIQAGKNAGCKTIFVLTGHGEEEKEKIKEIDDVKIFKNLLDFAESIKF
ncbi:MAG: D-glycero-beta-D-manno-heptose 1,7-bisphosphate 7-phosphatase [Candidatus Lokiarchaeota archaeon]